jgi:hypothetical protein
LANCRRSKACARLYLRCGIRGWHSLGGSGLGWRLVGDLRFGHLLVAGKRIL